MKIKELLNIIIGLHRRQPLTALMVWVLAMLMSGVSSLLFLRQDWPSDVIVFLSSAFIIGSLSFVLLASKMQALARVQVMDESPAWNVLINGVTAGQISDAAYASIRRDVLLDYRVYLAQLWNFFHVVLRVVGDFLVVIPALMFWLVVACMVFAPGDFAQTVLALQKITPSMVAANTLSVYQMVAPLFIIFIGVTLVVGRPVGFIDRFDEAVGSGVRRAIACSATGDIILVQLASGHRSILFGREQKANK